MSVKFAESTSASPKKSKKKRAAQKENEGDAIKVKKMKKTNTAEEENLEKKAKKIEKGVGKAKKIEKGVGKAQKVEKGVGKAKKPDKKANLTAKIEAKKSGPKTEEEKKAERKKQKELKVERQKKTKTEDVYQLGVEAKKIWEKVRRKEDGSEQEKETLLADLHASIKGQVSKLIFAHDTARVIECLVAMGTKDIRDELFVELKDELVPLVKSKYGHFFVEKLIKYGTKEQRAAIFKTFEGRVADLMKHKIANSVVETFYNEFANAGQRNGMLQEFCGPEFRAFKEPELRTVKDLLAKHPTKKKDVLKHLGDYVSSLINKGCYNHSLVHTVIYNYLENCGPKERSDTIEQLREVCVHVLHSHDGARLSQICLWHGTNKDRKAIIKSFKTFVTKICTDEHGYNVMLSVFDVVDDTKLVSKAILGEMADHLEEITASEPGKKVLMYLMAPRNTINFHPQVIENLSKGDDNEHSKKDAAMRSKELRDAISPALCKHLVDKLGDLLFDNPSTIFLTCVMKHATDKVVQSLMSQVAEEASKPFAKGDDEPNLVENTGTHMMLKKVIQHDKIRYKENADSVLFSEILLDALDEDGMESWVTNNRGAFLLVWIMETEIEKVQKKLRERMNKFKLTLKKQKTKGAEILRKKLN